ncbi:UDP-glucose dehydrogenase family protein [Bacteroides graminisolvens]|jgi:UDPglucose 6-dehydrogenase|uniref:UDP-glucose 6-dehydrogenase n=1 Tax=Bacteroides graminisolvens DSM 19988 = JCM 15093 TaxID=1121097 RepID=A0A069CYY3_9BACE|nr:UDP-glucose/GDP-mannose dehydrogenase family protein [Bacteroides graminisolvens]MBP6139727.1 UDP-glucose/GDP-mannose dehydrogenase family protein [Bacteroides sp.]MBP6248827.1 UDP-glucose/GDP-mannose dehydrogenase family protein [Bacteroides sp.]MBP9496322.1 UDP-glucose/GDP-mannose dehydrogenase family protein [Bacteroides sp.]MBP9721379.1 UDP-glucose/GDP-mannose dehydrogenase family protein [Bacteroides sp.]MDD4417708.1 UDP-glucose/GDP-mannose dehydrogenase family protein [Bacteroides gra
MNIAIVGTGYVGLVSGACFAEMGINVTCVDIDSAKIEKLHQGIMPIYEPGLEDLVLRNVREGRLQFTTDLTSCLDDTDVVFSAVGTPPDEDGSADLRYVLEVARTVGRHMNKYLVLVTKSTVPVGTAPKVRMAVQEELDKRGVNIPFDIASNPEFLKEGAAIKDFMSPDRVVVGVESEKARELMERLYRPFTLNGYPILVMDVPSAEMTKYAANAMLATRISFMNDIANLCERVGANVDNVRKGMGSDPRIGKHFLYAGCGYGGSCFPKDVKALAHTGIENGYPMRVIEAVEAVNEAQKNIVFEKLLRAFDGDLRGKVIAMWGLSFKPETDDMREAPSLVVIEKLIEAGAVVRAYDPIAMEETHRRIGDKITYCKDMYEAVIDADALALLTEWKQFRMPSWSIIRKAMRNHVVVDGRNIYDPKELQDNGFTYSRIGLK